jgi:aspartyl-tRNA(Asn)/glutamyl-tRNA(Gln) amidotransferase subunit A
VVGIKPSYGRVSRYGLIAFASSLDQIGPFAKDVIDAATLLGAIAGLDPLDSTSMAVPVPDYASQLNGDLKGVRVGVPKEYFIDGMQPEVEHVHAAVDVLKSLGRSSRSLAATRIMACSLHLPRLKRRRIWRFDSVRYGCGRCARPVVSRHTRRSGPK